MSDKEKKENESITKKNINYKQIILVVLVLVCLIIGCIFIFIDIEKRKGFQYVVDTGYGPQLNDSSQLTEQRTFDGMRVMDASIISENGETRFYVTLENLTDSKKGPYDLEITFLDHKGEELTKQETHVDEIEVGSKFLIETSSPSGTDTDIVKSYDFVLNKK